MSWFAAHRTRVRNRAAIRPEGGFKRGERKTDARRVRLGILAVAILALLPSSVAGDTPDAGGGRTEAAAPDVAEVCQRLKCRQLPPFTLRASDGREYPFDHLPPTPIAWDDVITIYPGEKLLIEATIRENRLGEFRPVEEAADPARTLSLSFEQRPGSSNMLLRVKSPFGRPVKYRAHMMLPDSESLVPTSSCPLIARGGSFEQWPHPIFQLVLTDFHFIDANGADAGVCN